MPPREIPATPRLVSSALILEALSTVVSLLFPMRLCLGTPADHPIAPPSPLVQEEEICAPQLQLLLNIALEPGELGTRASP